VLQTWLDDSIRRFQVDVLAPALEDEAKELEAIVARDLRAFMAELASLRTALVPRSAAGVEEASAVVGLALSGVGDGLLERDDLGGGVGLGDLLRGIPVVLGAAFLLALTGVGAPVAVGVAAGVGVARALVTGRSAAEHLRAGVCIAFVEALRRELPHINYAMERRVTARYGRIRASVDGVTGASIDQVTGQLGAVMEQRRAGEAALAVALADLHALRDNVEALRAEAMRLQAAVDAPSTTPGSPAGP